jgi:hypothetical protein
MTTDLLADSREDGTTIEPATMASRDVYLLFNHDASNAGQGSTGNAPSRDSRSPAKEWWQAVNERVENDV